MIASRHAPCPLSKPWPPKCELIQIGTRFLFLIIHGHRVRPSIVAALVTKLNLQCGFGSFDPAFCMQIVLGSCMQARLLRVNLPGNILALRLRLPRREWDHVLFLAR